VPVVFAANDDFPMATLSFPDKLFPRALTPTATLQQPNVFAARAQKPVAVLHDPVVL
jgi:hypothetical protein